MSLNKYKDITRSICVKKNWDNVEVHHLWMFLMEEIGELAAAIRRTNHQFEDRKKVSIESEIMDVLSYLFQLAYMYDVDLDLAFTKKLKQENCQEDPEEPKKVEEP